MKTQLYGGATDPLVLRQQVWLGQEWLLHQHPLHTRPAAQERCITAGVTRMSQTQLLPLRMRESQGVASDVDTQSSPGSS